MPSLSTDPDFHLKHATFRRKAADGTITIEEMREAVALMRQGRVSAATASAKSAAKKAAAAKPVDGDALLNELEGL